MDGKFTLWEGFIAYWQTPNAVEVSTRHSQNRRSDRKGKGIATHNLGATSKLTRACQLEEIDGAPPSLLRILQDAHTNRRTGNIDDPLTREIVEKVNERGEAWLQTQSGVQEVPLNLINEFTYEATPKDRNRAYGLPDYGELSGVSSFSQTGSSSYHSEHLEEIQTLKEKMAAIEAAREEDRRRMQAETEDFRRQMEEDRRRNEEDQRRMADQEEAMRQMRLQMNEFFRNFTPSQDSQFPSQFPPP